MSETQHCDEQSGAAPTAGDRLRMARAARGMTTAEAAALLKLSPRQIEALECGEFARLGGATFVRGFIRNYARLLRIDAGPVLAALPEPFAEPHTTLVPPADEGVRMPAGPERHGRTWFAATVLAVLMLAVALVLYFDLVDIGNLPGQGSGAAPTVAVPAVPPAAGLAQPQPVAETPARPEAAPPAAQPADTAAAETAAPAAATVRRRLVFAFDDNSWVEVKDGNGHTVFSRMNPKGTTQVVEGQPPFHLVVGNASRVRLQYDDRAVDLRPYTRVEVARLTLD